MLDHLCLRSSIYICVDDLFVCMLLQITFDHPSEYITRISGRYRCDLGPIYLMSITFNTNKATYGPYLPLDHRNLSVIDFNFDVGGKFYGFFGTFFPNGIESIGFYMKPIENVADQSGAGEELETKSSREMTMMHGRGEQVADQSGATKADLNGKSLRELATMLKERLM